MRCRLVDKVYRSDITLICGPADEAQRYIKRRYGDVDKIEPDTLAMTMRYEVDGLPSYVLWFRTIPSMATMAHEGLHLALWVLEHHEVRVRASEAEPACYYLEWIVNATRDALLSRLKPADTII